MNLEDDKKISVAIIEDEKTYREYLKDLLARNPNIRLFGEYKTGNEFLKTLKNPFKPDVCLVDIMLPDMRGTELSKEIIKVYSNINIIIMTSKPSSSSLVEAKSIGADYVEKGTIGEKLIDKLILHQTLIKSDQVISLKMTGESIHEGMAQIAKELEHYQDNLALLSEGQKDVFKLIQQGFSKTEVAKQLNISPKTVQNQINRGEKKVQLKVSDNLFKYLIIK